MYEERARLRALSFFYLVEVGAELAVAVVDQEPHLHRGNRRSILA
jgi:hypothetical protein